jgi:hypothetical protein
MALISWGLSRYPYYDTKGGMCDFLYECMRVLFCCQAGHVDSNDSDCDSDYENDVNLKND